MLGAYFIAEVLDLTENKRLKEIQAIAKQVDASAEDLLDAYSSAQSIAMDLSFHGVREIINFKKNINLFSINIVEA